MSKYFLLSASLIALLSSQTFASKQTARELADRESSQQVIIAKLMAPNGNNDYTLALDEEKIAERITKATLALNGNIDGQKPTPQQLSDLKFEAKRRILNNLDKAKESQARFGNGYFLTQNRAKALSVGNRCLPLVYPVQKSLRNESNAFYPVTYQNRGHGQYLYDEIKSYTQTKGLTPSETAYLNKYLEPLFYLVQEELHSMVTGLGKNKWVSQKSYAELLQSLQSQTDHHFYLVRNIPVKGLDQEQARTALLTTLLGKGLSFLPNPRKEIYTNALKQPYYLGKNRQGHLSLIHPSTNLPYPIFSEDRLSPHANIPHDLKITEAFSKQWKRVDQFVDLSDYHVSEKEKLSLKWILSGLGTLFEKHLSTFHVQKFPQNDQAVFLTHRMVQSFVDQQTIPEPYLTEFYQRDIDPDIHTVLSRIQSQGTAHRYLTSGLWPSRFDTEDKQNVLVYEALKYLMFKDILDRSASYNAYRELHRVGAVLQR